MSDVFPPPRPFQPEGFLPPMRSFAQNYEDVMLRRAFPDVQKGFYIDVGANHPQEDSVTHFFYMSGWRGINIEPSSQYLKLLEAARPEDVNLGVACGSQSGVGRLHVIADTGLSTTVTQYADLAKASGHVIDNLMEVKIVRLDEIIEEFCKGREIDFLKIDVEGAEFDVLKGIDLKRYRPKIIVVENTGATEYEPHLLDEGYFYVWFDGLNRVFIKWEDLFRADLIARPVSLWDNASKYPRIERHGVPDLG
jgi:FkbM family methyltransferase